MWKLIDWLFPPDSDDNPATLRRWRRAVFLALFLLGAAFGWAYSPYGFARAGDVAAQIKTAIEPLAKQQQETNEKLDVMVADTNELLIELFATKIRAARRARCNATETEERERANREIEQLQRQFQKRTGERYPKQDCDEI